MHRSQPPNVLQFDPNRPRARRPQPQQPRAENQTTLATATARLAMLETLNPLQYRLALSLINEGYRLTMQRVGGAR